MKPPIVKCQSCDKWPCECDNGTYCYKIGYGTCEESCYREFLSSERLSGEDLERVVAECVMDAVAKSHPSYHNLVESYMPDNEHFVASMKERGFVPMEYTAKFSVFGWSDLLVQDHWNREHDDEERRFLSGISRKLSKKVWRVKRRLSEKHEYFFFAESKDELIGKIKKEFGIRNIKGVKIEKGIKSVSKKNAKKTNK